MHCEQHLAFSPGEAYVKNPLSKEVKALLEKTEKGDAKSQYNLGWMYHQGLGVVQDDKEAMKWFRKAAVPSVVCCHAVHPIAGSCWLRTKEALQYVVKW